MPVVAHVVLKGNGPAPLITVAVVQLSFAGGVLSTMEKLPTPPAVVLVGSWPSWIRYVVPATAVNVATDWAEVP